MADQIANLFFGHVMIWIVLYFLIFYIIALFKTDVSVIDIAWGWSFALVMTLLFSTLSNPNSVVYLVFVGLWCWSTRLSGYVLVRKLKYPGEDFRYAKMRLGWRYPVVQSFTNIFALQWIIMTLMTLPLYFLVLSNHHFSWLTMLGLTLFVFGTLYEAIADHQKWKFKKHPKNRGQLFTQGLWHYSRHPNYFGEIVLWWGLFLMTVSTPISWLGVISPLIVTFLLLKVSGVTMLEKTESNYHGYEEYVKKTPALLPRFK